MSDVKKQEARKLYRDCATLKLAAEINDFIRSRTDNRVIGSAALEAARATFSLVPWPPDHDESPEGRHLSHSAAE